MLKKIYLWFKSLCFKINPIEYMDERERLDYYIREVKNHTKAKLWINQK